jgi:hypothetical protein
MSENIIEGWSRWQGCHRSNKGIIFNWESCKQICEDLLVAKRGVSNCQFMSKTTNLVEEICCCHVALLACGEFCTDLNRARRGEASI